MNLGKCGVFIQKRTHGIAKMLTGYQIEPEVIDTGYIVIDKEKSTKMSLMVFAWIIYPLTINIISILLFPWRKNNSTPFFIVAHGSKNFLQGQDAKVFTSVFLVSFSWSTPALPASNPFPQTPTTLGPLSCTLCFSRSEAGGEICNFNEIPWGLPIEMFDTQGLTSFWKSLNSRNYVILISYLYNW